MLLTGPLQWKSHRDYFLLGLDSCEMSGDELSDNFSLEAVVTQPGVTSDKDDDRRVTGESGDNTDLLGELMPEGEHYILN